MDASILVLGGGTFFHVRNHLSIAAPAFGTTARWLAEQLPHAQLVLTKMADAASTLETNEDVAIFIQNALRSKNLKCIVMNVAMCDYDGQIDDVPSGKHSRRLKSRKGRQIMNLKPSKKIIATIKNQRPDICLVGFKTTTHHLPEEQIEAAMTMMEGSQCDFVFANDTVTRYNMLINNQGAILVASKDRQEVLKGLVDQIQEQKI